ncbi:RHS repeat-associated core domain-containing protein [Pseudomonas sp. S37]|uniref:RHS repeat-associated core domain-containing protein n=1 Tax=Pseudomonas sp. S37 TaxID=2767449 RepID=UPI00191295D8|nr:RHS repeat-associated core domain-containing protein [Pseudomonas sp. S37]MBK4997696.1 RHS repeat-associated core domain-containing protein [Pseudomonas sp. S37]
MAPLTGNGFDDFSLGCARIPVQPNARSIYRFYRKSRLVNEIQGKSHFSIMQHEGHLLAQQQCKGEAGINALLGVDLHRTVLTWVDSCESPKCFTYPPYGHHSGPSELLAFNGERPDCVTGNYLLGNGYRAFNPVLMRFNSPDNMSPFGPGGLSSYSYCLQDPINYQDPSGHSRLGRFVSSLYSRVAGTKRPSREIFTAIHANVTPLLAATIRPFGQLGKVHLAERQVTMNGLGKVYLPPPALSQSHVTMNVVTGRTETAGYDFLGFHGSSVAHKRSLESGVDYERNTISVFGKGFYYTEDLSYAIFYAQDRGQNQGHVYGVYGKISALEGNVETIIDGYEMLVGKEGIKHLIVRDFIMYSPGQYVSKIRR